MGIWHFLDKLALPLRVVVDVEKPLNHPPPKIPQVDMSVLPDHDIISNHLRRERKFHCPSLFYNLEAESSVANTMVPGHITEPVRIVEVGGFLGDCVLWAGAWLGIGGVKALEVEPVTAATVRLKESLAR